MTPKGRCSTRGGIPWTPIFAGKFQALQMASSSRFATHAYVPRTPILVCEFQRLHLAASSRPLNRVFIHDRPRSTPTQSLELVQVTRLSCLNTLMHVFTKSHCVEK